jgi:hypothetical protein
VSRVWPLRGRDRQRQRILEGLEADRVQLVVGDAGIGKTRLVSEVVAALDGSGVRTGRVAGAAAAVSLPFAPFLGFRSGNEAAPSVTSVVAALVGDASNRSGTVAPPVLQVDDVHLLDDGSSSLLCQLALDGRVRLALTVRAGESLPRAVASLARDVEIDRIVLEPLPVEVSIDLLQAALDGPVDGATARRLAVSAGGNPLVLRELTEGAIDAGILVQRIGLWRLERELVVDPALLDLVAARLAALDQRARDTLELLALAGPGRARRARRARAGRGSRARRVGDRSGRSRRPDRGVRAPDPFRGAGFADAEGGQAAPFPSIGGARRARVGSAPRDEDPGHVVALRER